MDGGSLTLSSNNSTLQRMIFISRAENDNCKCSIFAGTLGHVTDSF